MVTTECRAFNTCPIDQVRVVIIGQDPYHNTGQAVGLSFSVPPEKAVPSSLQNIYKELHTDCGCTIPKHGNLEKVMLPVVPATYSEGTQATTAFSSVLMQCH